jgi:phospholipid-translocating ATPase
MEYCDLYRALLKGRELTEKTFMIWLWKSIYQGMVIMALTFKFFGNTFLDLVTITFSALILIEILNVFSELHRIRLITVIAQAGTLLVYVLSITFLKEYINVARIDMEFI